MSLTHKQQAIRRLKANRQALNYDPRPGPSSAAVFRESPVLYYQVYDGDLAPVRKGVIYAHSLEELCYMALDNAQRLGTFDELFTARPNFSARNMTIRDLILTSFVGTSDGKIETMLVCPYQGDIGFDLDTKLFDAVASDLVPNSRTTPLRIALNVPATITKWSLMTKPRFFSTSKSSDSLLLQLNNRVNLAQVVELRNDPQGSVRYSQKVLDELHARKNPPKVASVVVAPAAVPEVVQSDEATVAEAPAMNPVVDEDSAQDEPVDEPLGEIVEPETVEDRGVNVTGAEAENSTRAPIAIATDDIHATSSIIDVSSITAPLQASKLEDNMVVEADKLAVEANESNPVFNELENGHIPQSDTT